MSLKPCKPFGHPCNSSLAQIVVVHLKIFKDLRLWQQISSFKSNPIVSGDQFAFFLTPLSTSACTQYPAKNPAVSPSTFKILLWKRSQTWLFEDKAMNVWYTFEDTGSVDLYFIQLASKNLRTYYFAFVQKMKTNFWEQFNLSDLHLIAWNI